MPLLNKIIRIYYRAYTRKLYRNLQHFKYYTYLLFFPKSSIEQYPSRDIKRVLKSKYLMISSIFTFHPSICFQKIMPLYTWKGYVEQYSTQWTTFIENGGLQQASNTHSAHGHLPRKERSGYKTFPYDRIRMSRDYYDVSRYILCIHKYRRVIPVNSILL